MPILVRSWSHFHIISLSSINLYASIVWYMIIISFDEYVFFYKFWIMMVICFNSFPCILCATCLKETCTLQEHMLQDPRRLYAPGRLYHVLVRKPFGYVAQYIFIHIYHNDLRTCCIVLENI